jgi:hypothetical protein
MKFVVRPELPGAPAGSSQAPTTAVDNSAPVSARRESTYKSGKAVQTTGTTSAESMEAALGHSPSVMSVRLLKLSGGFIVS